MAGMNADGRPLAAHVVYRFDTGGLENGIVNLVNRMTDWRHAVIALTEVVPTFRARVRNAQVEFVGLAKPPGHGYKVFGALGRELRRLAPEVVHTRNLAALEMQLPAWWAGVPVRIHGEHGRDAHDVHGTKRRYQWLRRLHRPLVHRWVALSGDLEAYLRDAVGVPEVERVRICNGVDTERFVPAAGPGQAGAHTRAPIEGCPFTDTSHVLLGTVGRMQTVKAQPLLARAFVQAVRSKPVLAQTLRLVMVGEGALRAECEAVLQAGACRDLAWLSGERADVPQLMRGLDVFVLPSLAEGISNTLLEAMASGLPAIATAVGGNGELVDDGITGQLVPAGDVEALAQAIVDWADDAARRRAAGAAARHRVLERFSLDGMVRSYQHLYEELLAARHAQPAGQQRRA